MQGGRGSRCRNDGKLVLEYIQESIGNLNVSQSGGASRKGVRPWRRRRERVKKIITISFYRHLGKREGAHWIRGRTAVFENFPARGALTQIFLATKSGEDTAAITLRLRRRRRCPRAREMKKGRLKLFSLSPFAELFACGILLRKRSLLFSSILPPARYNV